MKNEHFNKKNADPRKCPRCQKGIVDKAQRRCRSCGGWNVWVGDESLIARLLERKDAWYIWDSSMGGWVYQEYYLNHHNASKY
jgi:hypothetical protein